MHNARMQGQPAVCTPQKVRFKTDRRLLLPNGSTSIRYFSLLSRYNFFNILASIIFTKRVPDCNTTYHNNYAVRGGTRFYYDGKPKYLQVGEHHYVEDKVVSLWVTLMVLGSYVCAI